MSQALVLAVDVGGTNIRAAIINASGTILDEKRIQADLSQQDISEHEILSILSQFLLDILQTSEAIQAIGIGFPGFFMQDSGVIAASPNLPKLIHFPLAEKLTHMLGIPVKAQNDALCAAIGEHRFGAGQGKSSLLHITLGTGIGGGLILNHTPYTGETGMAMEFGHICVDYHPNARRCGCGNDGCVEAYASATSIADRYAEKTHIHCNTQEIFQSAMDGEIHAIEILAESGTYLGKAIAEAIKLLDIHTVTISGGVVGAWQFLYPHMLTSLNQHLIPPLKEHIHILPSSLGDHAGILGAASIAFEGIN